MRRKIIACVALVFIVVVATVLLWHYCAPAWPPLRAGMSNEEVAAALRKTPEYEVKRVRWIHHENDDEYEAVVIGYQNSYFIHDGLRIYVTFDLEMHVTDWEVKESVEDESWLDRIKKTLGF
jgi:hypothetical protein